MSCQGSWTRSRAIIAAIALTLTAGIPSVLPAAGDATRGKVVYGKHCLACHGVQGRGDGPTGKVLIPPATDFSTAASRKKSDAELLKIIRDGKPPTAMPAWKGQLSEQEIQDVLTYIRSVSK